MRPSSPGDWVPWDGWSLVGSYLELGGALGDFEQRRDMIWLHNLNKLSTLKIKVILPAEWVSSGIAIQDD